VLAAIGGGTRRLVAALGQPLGPIMIAGGFASGLASLQLTHVDAL
jgi:hypothetical protein